MTEQNTGWRDIKTDPPLEGAKVLLLAGDFAFAGFVCDGEAVASGSPFGTTVWDASHWQPLAPPPGEEDVSTKPEKANTSPECVKLLDLCYVMQHALQAQCDGLRDELYQLKLLICGGEDAPGSANMLTLRDADEIEDRLDALRPVVDGVER